MASAYKFHGVYGGSYIIATVDSESPANFEEIFVTNNNKMRRFELAIIGELNQSHTVPDSLYKMLSSYNVNNGEYSGDAIKNLNMQSNFSMYDALYKLAELITNGKLRVFVDLPKNTGHKESILEQAVGAASDAAIVATSNNGADTENPNITNDKVNETPTETSIENQVKCADPVSMLTGEEILELEDFQLNSLLPLTWDRIYRSSKIKENIGLGYGWRHGFSLQLFSRYDAPPKVGPKQAGTHWFELIDEEGRRHAFNLVKRGEVSIQGNSGLGLINESKTRQVLIRPDNTHWVFTNIDGTWLLTTINNEFGHELSLHYDAQQRLVGIETTSNRGVILYYNSDNNIIRIAPYIIDKEGVVQVQPQLLASYQYNDNQSLIAAINAQGNAEQYKYNKNSLLSQRTRASGFNHYFEWDSDNEKAKCTHQWGDEGTYDYHFSFDGDKSSSTNTLGHTEYFYHNDQDLLTCHIDANGNKTEHQYDAQKRKIKTITGNAQTTHYHYNQIGQLSSVVEADGSETHFIYNAFGKRIATIDALGRQFKRHYNATGRLLSETQPDGRVTEYKYNDAGHLCEKTDASGLRTLYKWNKNGELLAEQVGEALTRYSYDKLGHINAICNAQDVVTEYQRNEQGQITREVSYHQREATGDNTLPDSALVSHYFYDKAGRLTNITNPAGENTHYGYGGLAQPTKKVFADGSWLNYQYDKERNLIGIERSDEATFQIEYSPTEKPTKLVGFDGRVQTYDYDANDKLTNINDADERIIQLKRDSLGRLIDQHSFTSQENKQAVFNSHNFYQYDKVGRVTLAHNSERVVQHQYHLNGQISQSKQGDWALDYQFNKQGQRSRLTLPDGSELHYEYDNQGQVTSLDYQSKTQQATQNLITRRYSNTGQLSQQTLGNDITLNQTFDSFGRLSVQQWLPKDNNDVQQDVKTSFNRQRHYTYDKKHQVLSCEEKTQSADDISIDKQSFNYNSLSQLVQTALVSETSNDLTSGSKQSENTDYQWDAFGNPKVDETKPKAMRETRVEFDRLLSFAGVDYRYDKSGNQISSLATGQIQKRSFDGLNQLRKINNNDKLSQYEYDALGRRSAKITEAGRTDFIWDGNQLIGEVSNGQYTWYIYLPDSFEPIALIKDNQIYYYHLDQLGTPICLTDNDQQVVWQNQADLFGCEDKSEQGSLEPEKVYSIENPLRFQGQYFDAESGLHYNRFRYYCPKQGRFIHQDPIGLAGGINHYQYAPNPVNWIDPFGLCKEENGTGFLDTVLQDASDLFDTVMGIGYVLDDVALDLITPSAEEMTVYSTLGPAGLLMEPGPFTEIGLGVMYTGNVFRRVPSAVDNLVEGVGRVLSKVDAKYGNIPEIHYGRYDKYLSRNPKNILSPDDWLVKAERVWANNKGGNGFEQAVRSKLNTPIGIGSKPISIEGFVPDLPVGGKFGVTDIKNVEVLSNSEQLRAFYRYADVNDMTFNLIVSPKTKSVSEPLLDQIRSTNGMLTEYNIDTGLFKRLDIGQSGNFSR